MAKYFTITVGLRGAYMPDSVNEIRVETRRELKACLENEASYIRGNYNGASKRAIAALAADAWRESKKKHPSYLPHVCGYGEKSERPFGIHVSVSNRADYLNFVQS